MKIIATLIVGLLLVVTVTAAYPYSPYTDNKDPQEKNVQLSEDAVAAYLKHKMNSEKLEPESIIKYVVALIQGSSKKVETDENECMVETVRTTESLQKAQLEKFLDTIYPVSGSSNYATLLTPDHGVNMYVHDSDPLVAYQTMLNDHRNNLAGIDNIWANYPPCPDCVRALISRYDRDELANEKPKIYVGQIEDFVGSNLTHIVQSLKCLAKLIHEGFEIVAWNYSEFKDTESFLATCTTVIDTYYEDANFTLAISNLVTHVTFVQELGANPHANSWCAD